MDRRTMLKTAGSAAGLAAVGAAGMAGAAEKCTREKPCIGFKNEQFYGADGKFDVEKGNQAVVTLCKYHGYPLFEGFTDNLWVSDYGLGKFMEVGLAAYMFMNNEKDRYMLMDLFLMPGQMLPEHWHLDEELTGNEEEKKEANPAKLEGWLVRWGLSHIVGIGEPNLGPEVVVPKSHWGGKVLTKHETVATPGMFVPLAEVESRHWQFAGPEGAIITEVANVHTNSAVRHSDPVMNEFFLNS